MVTFYLGNKVTRYLGNKIPRYLASTRAAGSLPPPLEHQHLTKDVVMAQPDVRHPELANHT